MLATVGQVGLLPVTRAPIAATGPRLEAISR
jgi:hypothetical protein